MSTKEEFYKLLSEHATDKEKEDMESILRSFQPKFLSLSLEEDFYRQAASMYEHCNFVFKFFKSNICNLDTLFYQHRCMLHEDEYNDKMLYESFKIDRLLSDYFEKESTCNIKKYFNETYHYSAFITDLAWRILYYKTKQQNLKEQIDFYKDILSIIKITDLNLKQINFLSNIEKLDISSPNMISLLQKEFIPFFKTHYIPVDDLEEMNKTFNNLKSMDRTYVSHVVRSIARSFVKYDIICQESTKGNGYNLKNEKGKDLALSNEIAILIHDIIVLNGFDTDVRSGKKVNVVCEGDYKREEAVDKKDFIKDKLKTSNKYPDDSIVIKNFTNRPYSDFRSYMPNC